MGKLIVGCSEQYYNMGVRPAKAGRTNILATEKGLHLLRTNPEAAKNLLGGKMEEWRGFAALGMTATNELALFHRQELNLLEKANIPDLVSRFLENVRHQLTPEQKMLIYLIQLVAQGKKCWDIVEGWPENDLGLGPHKLINVSEREPNLTAPALRRYMDLRISERQYFEDIREMILEKYDAVNQAGKYWKAAVKLRPKLDPLEDEMRDAYKTGAAKSGVKTGPEDIIERNVALLFAECMDDLNNKGNRPLTVLVEELAGKDYYSGVFTIFMDKKGNLRRSRKQVDGGLYCPRGLLRVELYNREGKRVIKYDVYNYDALPKTVKEIIDETIKRYNKRIESLK